jgi:glucokinase
MVKYLGIDLGGTKIAAGIVNEKGKVLKRAVVPTEGEKGQDAIVQNILKAVDSVYSKDVKAFGMGVPGSVDFDNGIITSTANLPITNLAIRDILQKRYKKPVFLDNDAKAFTLGEAIFGEGKKYKHVIGITLGTGVGGGLVIDKKIYHGRGNATEFGHMTIFFNSDRERKGNKGDFECFVGTVAIKEMAAKLDMKDAFELHEEAKAGNHDALQAWHTVGKYLGILLYNITRSVDPDIIVFGGNISNNWDFFCKSMEDELKLRLQSDIPILARSKMTDSTIVGAACLAMAKP